MAVEGERERERVERREIPTRQPSHWIPFRISTSRRSDTLLTTSPTDRPSPALALRVRGRHPVAVTATSIRSPRTPTARLPWGVSCSSTSTVAAALTPTITGRRLRPSSPQTTVPLRSRRGFNCAREIPSTIPARRAAETRRRDHGRCSHPHTTADGGDLTGHRVRVNLPEVGGKVIVRHSHRPPPVSSRRLAPPHRVVRDPDPPKRGRKRWRVASWTHGGMLAAVTANFVYKSIWSRTTLLDCRVPGRVPDRYRRGPVSHFHFVHGIIATPE